MRPRCLSCIFVAALLAGGPATAEWPYLTEEASNLAEGQYSLALGLGFREQEREVYHQGGDLLGRPTGRYWAVPEAQGTLGVGTRAEVSFDYQYFYYQAYGRNETRWESGDLRLWTKLGLLRGPRSKVSLRFGVKLPNSAHLGTNEGDFFSSGLYDRFLGDWVASANLGFGVLGNPAGDRKQDDVLTWAAAFRSHPGREGFLGGVEAAGISGPFGLSRRRDAITCAAVVGWRRRDWRIDTALRYGTDDAKGWGWLVGATYSR